MHPFDPALSYRGTSDTLIEPNQSGAGLEKRPKQTIKR
jgi:hypothetical protein